jgi:O-acetyl-ADP-ribose deacetylase (regulator of RNase III)/tRNA A-37 threonylcarbamoyl transferase component Bud32
MRKPLADSGATAPPTLGSPPRPVSTLAAAVLRPAGLPGYEVLEEVGRGGMGVVYRARQARLDRPVALKVMLPGAPTDRFLREAKILAKIGSPHVVTIHDFAILPDGSPLLVMEWIEGRNLLQVMSQRVGSLREEEALPWMRQACEGLLAAAEQGITHRDFKPSNLLIDNRGRARVADFGLARGPTSLGELTVARGMMGTPFYMAPEQAEDPRGVDTRTDIYSFGATFYHALTGAPPFEGETAFAILFKHKMEPLISPTVRNPGLSDRISEVLERCLAKSPGDRFPSFAEVLKHLQPTASAVSPWDAPEDQELAGYLARYQARRAAYLAGQLAWGEVDTYSFPGGQVVRIERGDIVQQRVEAIVNSASYRLDMYVGVSAAIRQAAGPAIEQETRRYDMVRPGRAVVTSAGALPARFVFHGVTVGRLQGEVVLPSRDLISEIMASCFYHADSLNVLTIAFPLLGTGAAGFPEKVCLDTMFRFLARTFLRGVTSVHAATIVLYD